MKNIVPVEPDFATACRWWPDLRYIWTPLGWKDHMFRFNVFWNGTLMAQPFLNRRTESWKGQGAQFAFLPLSANGGPQDSLKVDDGITRQGWNKCPAPVLWTEWGWDGSLFRQEAFAHMAGGGDTQTGIEPLFAWVRLSVAGVISTLPLEEECVVQIFIQAPHIYKRMTVGLMFIEEDSLYPQALSPDKVPYDPRKGLRILDEAGKVRMGVAPGQSCRIRFLSPSQYMKNAYRLEIRLPLKQGAHVHVLLPMLPTEPDIFDRELALGFDRALKEANRHWAPQPGTAASISVPEPFINEAVKHSVRFSQMIAERNPATGKFCKIIGSWVYANLWATPAALDLIMLMDTLGYHNVAARYLDIFREEQGTVVPPGDAYKLHPGYLSTPALYKSIDWLTDNGALLYTLATHGLISGDRGFIEKFTDTIVKSCEWIRDFRAATGHGGYEGILPAAVASDRKTKIQALWNDGWNYKGLCAAVRLLKKTGHSRAKEFEQEAREYKAAFLKALRDKCRKMPTWTDGRGRKHVLVPCSLSGDQREETRHAFYLDGGPLFLVFAGLINASDPLMRDTLAWFREGPQHRFSRYDSNCWRTPVLDHEMSSCEPCYSWNVFHSWQSADREKFLEGMYSLFAGSISRQTFTGCETRGGITGVACTASMPIYLARLAVVDDQIAPGEMHLLRLMPLAWLKPGDACAFETLPTEFGPVTLKTRMSKDGKTLNVVFQPAFRKDEAPEKIILYRPPAPGLKQMIVNGRSVAGKTASVRLA